MSTYLNHKKRVRADARVEQSTVSLDAPIMSPKSKPGSEQSGTYADVLPERETTDPEKLYEKDVQKPEKAQEIEKYRKEAPAKLTFLLNYYTMYNKVLPELQNLIDTLYSIYINENVEGDHYESDEVKDLRFEEKYKKGPSVKSSFERYFFENINDILSSSDVLTYGIKTIKMPYLEQVETLKHGI